MVRKVRECIIAFVLLIFAMTMSACSSNEYISDSSNEYISDDSGQKKCTVTLIADAEQKYDINKGERLSTSQLNPNSSDATKESNFFVGWFTDQEMTIRFDSTKQIEKDMTLYGKYISFSDAIIEFMHKKNTHDGVYYSYNIANSSYFNSLLSFYLSNNNAVISIDLIKNIYNTDSTGKDNVYVSITDNTSGTKGKFDWNIIKGNGAQAIVLTDASIDVANGNATVYPAGTTAQHIYFNSKIDYKLKQSNSVKMVTTQYYSGLFTKDYVTPQARFYIWYSVQVINDVLLKEVANELNLKIQ